MYHNVRDARGKFVKVNANTPITKIITKTIPTNKIINHIALVVDASGSMTHFQTQVVNQFNKQIETIKENARKTNQETYVSLYTFEEHNINSIFKSVRAEDLRLWNQSDYVIGGSTPLLDAVGQATTELFNGSYGYHDKNVSFLVIVLTDGVENYSRTYNKETFKRLIQEKTATDRWTFAFSVPFGYKSYVTQWGIPEGNIQEWEQTTYGLDRAVRSTIGSTQSYFTGRTLGATKTMSFYAPDLSSLTASKLSNLTDSSKEFLRLEVKEDSRIDNFVEKTTGNPYVIGSGLYQLTKSENVQDYKKIVVRDKQNNYLYKGQTNARNLLKLPANGTIKLRPSQHSQYDVFVQSTAPNRKLIAGTVVLLDKSMI